MKQMLKFEAKKIGMTAAEIGTLGGSMILTKKFLDFNTLFKNKIAADPTFADKWYIKHQGAIKLGVGLIASTYVKNPWLKLVCFGVALEGFISEVRVLTTGKDGVAFFDKIGNTDAPSNESLLALAQQYDNGMMGINPVSEYGTSVAAINPVSEYGTSVAGGTVDLTESINYGTAGTGKIGWGEWQLQDSWAA